MKPYIVFTTVAISFQICAADMSNVGYGISWGFGWKDNGIQCSTNLVADQGKPVNNVAAFAGKTLNNLILKNDGSISSFGSGPGISDLPPEIRNVTEVSVGSRYGMALLKNGTVKAWGDAQFGKTIVPDGATNVIAIATGSESCVAVRQDGTVIGWGQNKVPEGLNNVADVAMSALLQGSNLALKRDGTVAEWSNYNPSSVHLIKGLSNVISIAVGPAHKLALKQDGTVVAWGSNLFGETNVPAGLNNVVAIAAGGFLNPGMSGFGYSLALKKDGTITAWGVMGFKGEPVIVPEGLSNVVVIAANGNCCFAITTSQNVANKFITRK